MVYTSTITAFTFINACLLLNLIAISKIISYGRVVQKQNNGSRIILSSRVVSKKICPCFQMLFKLEIKYNFILFFFGYICKIQQIKFQYSNKDLKIWEK